jgi:tol-pal system protein YbgF
MTMRTAGSISSGIGARSSAARLAAAALLALSTSACVSSSDIEKIQSQISDLQDQVAQLKRTAAGKEEVQNVNARIAEQTQTLLKSNATLVTKVDAIEDRLNNTQGSLEQTGYRVDRLVQQVTATQHQIDELKASMARTPAPGSPAGSGVNPAPTPPMSEVTVDGDAGESPAVTYQAAYRDYQRGNFDLAIAGFREVVQKHPQSELADNAAYWIGESLYSQKKYRDAIAQFDSVVNDYPKSDKVASALLKKGYAYINLNEKAQGIVQLQYVVHEHPKSPEAAKAREELKRLGVDSK